VDSGNLRASLPTDVSEGKAQTVRGHGGEEKTFGEGGEEGVTWKGRLKGLRDLVWVTAQESLERRQWVNPKTASRF